jgi:hypothetical protein
VLSKEHVASTFRVEDSANQARRPNLLQLKTWKRAERQAIDVKGRVTGLVAWFIF